MAMFQQYTGGIAPVQGISEAGARIGQFAQQGLQDFGKSLAEGIQTYHENVAKDQVLTQEAQALGQQIQQYAQIFGNSPEHEEFTKSLQPYIEQLSKVPSQSLTQKMGTVTGVKAAFANIGGQLQAFELMRNERLKRTMAEAGYRAPSTSVVYSPSALKKGSVEWNQSKTATQNISDFDELVANAQRQGHEIDPNDARQRFIANMKQSIDSDQKIDPRLKATLKDQIDAYDKYKENAMTDESGATDYGKEAELYGKVEASALDQMKGADKGSPSSVSDKVLEAYAPYKKKYEDDIAELIKKQEELKAQVAEEERMALFKKPENIAERLVGIAESIKNKGIKAGIDSITKIDENGNLSLDATKVGKDIASTMNTWTALANFVTKSELSPIDRLQKDKEISKVMQDVSQPSAKDKLLENQVQLEQTKNLLGRINEATGSIPAQQAQEQPQSVQPITNNQDIIIGQKPEVVQASLEDKKQAMQEYFMSKYKDASGKSYLPAGFDEAFKAANPEASFKTMETPYGAFVWNGKEWNQIKMKEPKTIQQQREEMKGVFGVATENGFKPMQVGEGTGVSLQGIFTGTDGELGKYKDHMSDMASSRSAIAELRSIIGQFGHSLNPDLIGRAKIAMATLRAATRVEVIGVGTVSEAEQKMLNDANPDATKTFNLDSVDLAKLDSLARKIDNKMKMLSTMNGVTLRLAPPTFGREGREAIEAGLRQRNPQLYRR